MGILVRFSVTVINTGQRQLGEERVYFAHSSVYHHQSKAVRQELKRHKNLEPGVGAEAMDWVLLIGLVLIAD